MYEYKTWLERSSKRPFLVQEKALDYGNIDRMEGPAKIVDLMNTVYGLQDLAEEHLYMTTLTTKMNVTGVFLIGAGTVDLCPASSRDIFTKALLAGASCIALIHNHPSGDPTPSHKDFVLAKRVATAGWLVNVTLMDFIIVGSEGHYRSFHETDSGLLEPDRYVESLC